MQNNKEVNNMEPQVDGSQQIERILLRILPYWPLVLIALLLGYIAAKLQLRYEVSSYAVNAKLLVNDDEQQKTASLQDVFAPYKDLSVEAAKEIEILRSRDLIEKLVSKLQLNVSFSQKGRIKTTQVFKDLPFTAILENPDSVLYNSYNEIKVIGNQINFNGKLFPTDSLVNTDAGKMRFHLNSNYKPTSDNDLWYLSISPVRNAVGAIRGALSIAPISEGSTLLLLTYTDESPEKAVLILNTLIDIYGSSYVDYKSRLSANTLQFLDERLKLVSGELTGVEKNIEEFRSRHNIVDLGTEGKIAVEQLKKADEKIAEYTVQMDVIKQIEQYVTRRNNSNSSVPATLGISDPVLTTLLNQLYQTEFELEKTKQVSGEKNPKIEVYEEAISKLKPSILASINNLKLTIQTSRQRLESDNNKVMASMSQIPEKERILLEIGRQQSIKNAIYTFLLQKREEAAITATSILPNYRIIEKPQEVGMVAPVPMRNYTAAILLALFLSALFIYFKEFFGSRILYKSQIEQAVQLPVVAEIIFQPHSKDTPIVISEGKRSFIAEQFRELRTNLSYITANSKDNCKVLLVTSSIPKEGKSFISINTAISLTLAGSKVVIIEGDLRNPKISKPIGINASIGISNYLIGKATADEIIIKHPEIKNLSVIPCGPVPPNPAELLSTPKLAELIDHLKQQFDYIIIDSPPVAAVTDSKILATVADATLYIIRHNYSNLSLLNLIKDVNQKKSLPNINLVFNGISNKKILGYGNKNAYGYSYGYGYTSEEKRDGFFKRLIKKFKS